MNHFIKAIVTSVFEETGGNAVTIKGNNLCFFPLSNYHESTIRNGTVLLVKKPAPEIKVGDMVYLSFDDTFYDQSIWMTDDGYETWNDLKNSKKVPTLAKRFSDLVVTKK